MNGTARDELSKGLSDLWMAPDASRRFDVVVVGSGYGGSVAASELAGRGLRVCVLERGSPYHPGDFPSDLGHLPGHVRLASPLGRGLIGNPLGLFDLRAGPDVVALVANGLGGGSLINAGVLLTPSPDDPQLDPFMRNQVRTLLDGQWFKRARKLLSSRPGAPNAIGRHPDAALLAKRRAMRGLDAASSRDPRHPQRCLQPPVSVAMTPGQLTMGHVSLEGCALCGDCMTGCNVGAKASLDTQMLRWAHHNGVEIYTGATVHSLRRSDDGRRPPPEAAQEPSDHWVLRVTHTDPQLQAREAEHLRLYARHVILAAGTLGSTEILLRSRSERLVFSSRLGERFSCNGDNIAAITGASVDVNASAQPGAQPWNERSVGPTITTSIEVQGTKARFLVQEFAIPGALKSVLDEVVTTTRVVHDMVRPDLGRHPSPSDPDAPDPVAVSATEMSRTLVVGVIGHDEGRGSLFLHNAVRDRERPYEQGTLRIHWPEARHSPFFDDAHAQLERMAAAWGPSARVLPNPLWRLLPPRLEAMFAKGAVDARGPVVTVHPLGGCPMGSDAQSGVVDELGVVFDAALPAQRQGASTWQGSLVVLDGSVVRGSLGVNPALTITALALRAMAVHAPAWSRQPAAVTPPPIRHQVAAFPVVSDVPTEIAILERLTGRVDLSLADGPVRPHMLELTLHFAPFKIRDQLSMAKRVMTVDAARSTLRLYPIEVWNRQALHAHNEETRRAHAVSEQPLSGTLAYLHREPSCGRGRQVRALASLLVNRLARAGLQRAWDALTSRAPRAAAEPAVSLWDRFEAVLAIASRAGEVRRFDYSLWVGGPGPRPPDIQAEKRLVYGCGSNPWRQVTELRLTRCPGLRNGPRPVLRLDPQFFAEQRTPLLQVVRQGAQPQSWMELLQFGGVMLRAMLRIHLWSFVPPDERAPRQAVRLPGPVAGLPPPEITELVVDRVPDRYLARPDAGAYRVPSEVTVRLTRYRRERSLSAPPLVLIHGYSTSGNTFTHESLPCSAVSCLAGDMGRDVWVLDLRTSSGMPHASLPWSMERVALVDIPAALMHVRQVTGQPVDVFAHCIGAAMLSMALLTDADEIVRNEVELGADTWIDSVPLGVLKAFNGARSPSSVAHPCVRRVVLSQKGPWIRYTPRNIFFASFMQVLRRWLPLQAYRFERSVDPGRAEVILDQLLGSLPYPGEPEHIERPLAPWRRTPWTATRHRMDLLYGRVFEAEHLDRRTLGALDDLFGPFNMDTLAQVIHFARTGVVTNQSGRGEFVSLERLHERWRHIPTLLLHGARNGMVDPNTLKTQCDAFRQAGVPVQSHLSADSGHQDLLIGKQARTTFEQVDRFLSQEQVPPPEDVPAAVVPWCRPWIGPCLRSRQGQVRLTCMVPPQVGRASLWLVELQPRASGGVAVGPLRPGGSGASGRWLSIDMTGVTPQHTDSVWITVLMGETPKAISPMARLAPAPLLASLQSWLAALPDAERHGLTVQPQDLQRAADASSPAAWREPQAMTIGVGSCQYPPGIFHARPGQESLSVMAEAAASVRPRAVSFEEAPRPIDLALFMGDQIYADATAGLADAARRDERFDYPHEQALRLPAMRSLMRQVPVYTLPDDHEIRDNWSNRLPPQAVGAENLRADENWRLRKAGLAAWHRYWCASNNPGAVPETADHPFDFKGHPFFLLDVRTVRDARGSSGSARGVHMVSAGQLIRLRNWLGMHKDRLKFIGTSSLFWPRRRTTEASLYGRELSDAWDGYPITHYQVLDMLLCTQARRTVFLSGDEHHSLYARVSLRRGAHPVSFLSVHASALHAPYPFANGRIDDLCGSGVQRVYDIEVNTRVQSLSHQDGYVELHVDRGAAAAGVHIRHIDHQGRPGPCHFEDLR